MLRIFDREPEDLGFTGYDVFSEKPLIIRYLKEHFPTIESKLVMTGVEIPVLSVEMICHIPISIFPFRLMLMRQSASSWVKLLDRPREEAEEKLYAQAADLLGKAYLSGKVQDPSMTWWQKRTHRICEPKVYFMP